MCMEDIRLGRKIRVIETFSPAMATTDRFTIPANKDRVFLILSAAQNGQARWTISLPFSNSTGFSLAAGQLPLSLNIRDHGQLVTARWTGVIYTASQSVCAYEGVLDEY